MPRNEKDIPSNHQMVVVIMELHDCLGKPENKIQSKKEQLRRKKEEKGGRKYILLLLASHLR